MNLIQTSPLNKFSNDSMDVDVERENMRQEIAAGDRILH